MKGSDKEASIFHVSFDALSLISQSFQDFFFQKCHHVLDIAGAHQATEADVHNFLAHVQGRARQGTEYVHDHAFHHMTVMFLHLLQSIQHDQLDVVVRLLGQQSNVSLRRLVDGNWGRRQRD